jgi:phosphoribosyl-ATP pyrophosphohydrolase
VAERRKKMPEGSYTTHLFNSGSAKIRKKLGEEAVELILAGKKDDISYEAADLVYHMLVLLENESVSLDSVLEELEKRMG